MNDPVPSNESGCNGNEPTPVASPIRVLYVRTTEDPSSTARTLEQHHRIDVCVTELPLDSDEECHPAGRFDCIVCTLSGDDQSSLRTLDRFLSGYPQTPVVAYFDGSQQDSPMAQAVEQGADEVLSKEADNDDARLLARRIRSAVALNREKPSRSGLQAVAEDGCEAILYASASGYVTDIEYVRSDTSLPVEDLKGSTLEVLESQVEETERYRAFVQSVREGEKCQGTVTVTSTDGQQYRLALATGPSVLDAESGGGYLMIYRSVRNPDEVADTSHPAHRTYKALIEAAPDPIFLANIETGTIVDANEAAATLLERSIEDIVGMNQVDLHPTGDRDRYRDLFELHQKDGTTIIRELDDGEPIYIVTADGETVPVEINASVVELEDRTLLLGIFRDLSEQRKRERTLEAILSGIPDIGIVFDNDGTYREVLAGREELPIQDTRGLIGTDVGENLDEDVAQRIRSGITQAIETGDIQQIEYERPSDSGEKRWFDARIAPIESGAYDSETVVFLARDVTDRKMRERDLRGLRKAVEHAGHVVMLTDVDGHIQYVNPAFERVTGYSKAEAIGERPAMLQSGEHDEEFYEEMWETILAGDVWEGHLINERKDGEQYTIAQTIAPIFDMSGSIEGFVSINRDVTELRKQRRTIKRERDRLDDFAQTVAHDLRNPLSIAIGHTELALDGEPQSEDHLQAAVEAQERMASLIDEILTLSKHGQTVLQTDVANLADAAESAWDLVESTGATLSIGQQLHETTVDADRVRLIELLTNLFQNAIEHAGNDVNVAVGGLPNREGFYVADTGSGIDPADRNRIFESGFTTADDGTGYGLSIVKQIVEAHGWEVSIATSKTGGARFEIVTDRSPHTSVEPDEERDG